MSTPSYSDPSQSGPSFSQTAQIDEGEVLRAKQEIQGLVQEIVEISKSEADPIEFYDALLTKSVAALAAIGGVVWTLEENGSLKLQFQINLQNTGLADNQPAQLQHGRLLQQVIAKGEPTLVLPHSGAGYSGMGDGDEEDGEEVAANPTDFLLVLAPIASDRGVEGVVEIFQRDGARPSTQRGYLRFLEQICELAGEYVKSRRLKHYATKQTLWEQLESFTSSVHQCLNSRATAYTIANEGRRLIGCDRVTVVLRKGSSYRVESISGQDTFDKRSNVVRLLRNLAKTVAKTGDDLWFEGDTSDLAPQVEKAVNAYVDESHTKQLAVLPLHQADDLSSEEEPEKNAGKKRRVNILGALVIEQLVDSRPPEGLMQRVDVVRRHSSTSLTNAQEHESLFLMPLWRLIGKARWLVSGRTLPKTVTVLVLLAGAIFALCTVPYDFTVTADGNLLPELRRNVFAQLNGQVVDVPVGHGDHVEKGQLVARQRSSDLDQEILRVWGEYEGTLQQISTIKRRRMRLDVSRSRESDMDELVGQLAQLNKRRESLDKQRELLDKKKQQLEITSPISGKVVTWKVRDLIQGRTVSRGQRLMEIADPSSDWELEIYVPEAKMGHIVEQRLQQQGKLKVTYILATHPSIKLSGEVEQVDTSAEMQKDSGNTVRMRVSFAQEELKKLVADPTNDLKVGADVKAKIHCGQRAIGYVWFHDLFEFVQSKILFRF